VDKLYVIVRGDLPPGDQAVQSMHAALKYAKEHSDWTAWYEASNYIALLSVPNERELMKLLMKARDRDLKFAAFCEPDLDDSMTAIALEPGFRSRRLCNGLPLALSENQNIPA